MTADARQRERAVDYRGCMSADAYEQARATIDCWRAAGLSPQMCMRALGARAYSLTHWWDVALEIAAQWECMQMERRAVNELRRAA